MTDRVTADVSDFRFGRFRLDASRRILLVDGKPARLGARAIDVLIALARRRERIVGKNELFDLVWPGLVVEENNLQVHVSALRKLLGPEAIATIPGRGYQFIALLDDERHAASVDAPVLLAEGAAPPGGLSTNLPRLPEVFGRTDEIVVVRDLVRRHPLVTIAGTAGIGKTTLAIAAAQGLLGQFANGVWMVELAAAVDAPGVMGLVGRTLGIAETQAPMSVQSLAASLRTQSMLLVLDNCEHVLEPVVDLIGALRSAAPKVRVLATSQENLRLADEQVVRLAPLAVADSDTPAAAHAGAVQLFAARAKAAVRDFNLDDASLPAVAEICRRLDGLPLAIELAAARLPLLGVDGIRARLNERFRVLTGGARLAPRRHQTLHAAFEWSHDLLSAPEQRVFRRLGVFVGGFSLELAQQVAADAQTDRWAVLDHLGDLVDKSLVIAEGRERPRYRLMETARAFALEQLDRAGETDALLQRHAEAVLQTLQEFDRAVAHQPDFEHLVEQLKPELDNLHAALQWACTTPGEHETAIALVAHSDWLWNEVELWREGCLHCRRVEAWIDDSTPPPLAARFWLSAAGLGRSAMVSGSIWVPWARRSAEQCRALRDSIGLYRSLCLLAGQTDGEVDHAEAERLLAEAERIENPDWAPRLRLRRQATLEWWYDLNGEHEKACAAGERHVALSRQAGGTVYTLALSNLADTKLSLGDVEASIALCREAIARAEGQGRPSAAMNAYANAVPALLMAGRIEEAEDAIRSGRAACLRAIGTAFVLLPHLPSIAAQRGAMKLAAQLLGCAEQVYEQTGRVMHPPERRACKRVLAQVQEAFTAHEVDALLREGSTWNEDEAFARAGLA